MDERTVEAVRIRANFRCEYCLLSESLHPGPFEVEHIVAHQHGGSDAMGNLAVACRPCNWAKGPNLAGRSDGKLFPLFHPRMQNWSRHFRWEHTTLVGKTKTGIVTVQVLNMNEATRLMLRENLLFEGRFPPDA